MNLSALSSAIAAVCPAVLCVSIGDTADKTTWRLSFGDDATDDQKQAAQNIVTAWVDPPPPTPTLPDISDKQCFQQLAVLGKVTQADALAAVKTGTMPDVVTNGIAALPAAEQFPAEMAICGSTTFQRSNPLVPAFMAMMGITAAADIDTFWQAAALL